MAESIGVKFIKDGPSIPLGLLQAFEAGKVVIFCGAGVSRRCGLPGFKGLVTSVCKHLTRQMEPDEQQLFAEKSFDGALGLIENRIGKPPLRRAVRQALELNEDSDFSTHQALLKLAISKEGHLRLVTTNFDKAFLKADFSGKPEFDYAPYLPVPGHGWSSVVHLHGGFGNERERADESLVLTSADFGRAYITEGWASRFLSELFRRAGAILFVGYSVSDPAIRYIVDAFAADRAGREAKVAEAFIFVGAEDNEAAQRARTWKSRGIEPIVYDPRDNHWLLHETLESLAKKYTTGFFDRDSIVLEYASQSPLGGLEQEAISQVTWALRDESGHAARTFSRMEPPPSLEWLEFLEEAGLFDLVPPDVGTFSPVGPTPAVNLIGSLHPVSLALCGWLCSHLGKKALIQWVIKRGCHLHPSFANHVRQKLAKQDGPQITKGAKLIWTFLSTRSAPVYDPSVEQNVLSQVDELETAPWSPPLRDQVLSWITPAISFGRPFSLYLEREPELESVSGYAEIELVPAAGHRIGDVVGALLSRADATAIAQDLLIGITESLRKGLTYLQFFEKANADYDGSFLHRPSIDEHCQNSQFSHWSPCVRLLRECWQRVASTDLQRAREEVTQWMRIQLPLFRRFVIWSSGRSGGLSASESVDYLMEQPSSAIWGLDTHRELLQYLGRIAPQLPEGDAARLCGLILQGPPRNQYRADITEQQLARVSSRAIYLRLAKLRDGGLALPDAVRQAINQIIRDYPEWDHPITEQEEFLSWVGGEGEEFPYEFERQLDDYLTWNDEAVLSEIRDAPGNPKTIARWRGLFIGDAERAMKILGDLGALGVFDSGIWALPLDYVSNEKIRPDCVRLFGTFGNRLEEHFIQQHLHNLTTLVMLHRTAEGALPDDLYWRLWDLLLLPATEIPPDEGADRVFEALNSPIGNLTDALLHKLGELNPGNYDEIPKPTQGRLEALLNGSRPAHRQSRTLLASALGWLYRLKPDLVAPNFLSLFNWDVSDEARNVWSGYLRSPRMTPELWFVIRPLFLKLFPHSSELGAVERPLYSLLAHLLLREEFQLDPSEAQYVLRAGTAEGRELVAWYWWRQADSATDYGATLFRDRLKHLLTSVWPKELELKEEGSSERLADLALCCGTEFEDAVATIIPLLTKITKSQMFLWSLKKKDYADKFPEATLSLIDSLIGDQTEPWGMQDLRTLLTRISTAEPSLTRDPRFIRLDALVRRFE